MVLTVWQTINSGLLSEPWYTMPDVNIVRSTQAIVSTKMSCSPMARLAANNEMPVNFDPSFLFNSVVTDLCLCFKERV